ncbi:hypothetical protein EV426DRAFT_574036 [Tirmania nivea]|nr:hypothetical protein EV426DRAFT_574036 [Tirmania nivea]
MALVNLLCRYDVVSLCVSAITTSGCKKTTKITILMNIIIYFIHYVLIIVFFSVVDSVFFFRFEQEDDYEGCEDGGGGDGDEEQGNDQDPSVYLDGAVTYPYGNGCGVEDSSAGYARGHECLLRRSLMAVTRSGHSLQVKGTPTVAASGGTWAYSNGELMGPRSMPHEF